MSTLTLTEVQNEASFDSQVGDLIVVLLDETPTTGFRWAIEQVDEPVLRLEHDEFLSPSGAGIGAGGRHRFTFIAQSPGSGRIRLKLWRDWEGDKSVIKRFSASINVN